MAPATVELNLSVDKDKLRAHERRRIVDSFNVLNIGAREQLEVLEALDSPKWDWLTDCDGCSAVSEVYWPNKYYPPCVRHDYDFLTSANGMESNARFYRLQRAYGMTKARAAVRWLGVTVGWFGWYKWRNMMTAKKGVSK